MIQKKINWLYHAKNNPEPWIKHTDTTTDDNKYATTHKTQSGE